jgi:hypothetical protein
VSLDELDVLELRAGADQRDEMGCVRGPPAGLGGLDGVELGQRPECGVAGAGDRATRAGEQRDRGGDRLLVVEGQRRQVLPRAELVPPPTPWLACTG